MEIFKLDSDLPLLCVTAASFPREIGQAFNCLLGKLKGSAGREFFGISYLDDKDGIIYKAAALEAYPGEGIDLGLEQFTVQKGRYVMERIGHWRKDKDSIGMAFRKMVESFPDTTFPCVEWYQGEEVRCLVKLGVEK